MSYSSSQTPFSSRILSHLTRTSHFFSLALSLSQTRNSSGRGRQRNPFCPHLHRAVLDRLAVRNMVWCLFPRERRTVRLVLGPQGRHSQHRAWAPTQELGSRYADTTTVHKNFDRGGGSEVFESRAKCPIATETRRGQQNASECHSRRCQWPSLSLV